MVSIFGCSCKDFVGVQSAMKSAKSWNLIVDLETKSIVCSASCVAHLPILPEASLFSNMPDFNLVALEIVAKLCCSHDDGICHLLHF